jgi:hypothetical protein
MTETLNKNSYWASYNNIYFPDFRNISGEEAQAKEKGPDLYSWQNSSRAKIFRRDHNKVIDLPTMIHMMRFIFENIFSFCVNRFDLFLNNRYNDFQHDDLSKCNCTPPYSAELTISARDDLNDINGTYPDGHLGHRCLGATDVKVRIMSDHSSLIISFL